jgi:hypothetical protein
VLGRCPVKTTKVTLKRIVLNRLYDHLCSHYSVQFPRRSFLEAETGSHIVDAVVAFKSDIEIEVLTNALNRIEDGSFGTCWFCGRRIPLKLLKEDPAVRVCRPCEDRVLH